MVVEAMSRQNKVLELDPHHGEATCGGAGELLAGCPLRSADLGRMVSSGTVDVRPCRGVCGVCSGVGGLLLLLSSPRPAVVARERKGMAPPSSCLGLSGLFWWCAVVTSCSFFRPAVVARRGGGSTWRRWLGPTARGLWIEGSAWSPPFPACSMVWKRLLALTPWGGHSCGV